MTNQERYEKMFEAVRTYLNKEAEQTHPTEKGGNEI